MQPNRKPKPTFWVTNVSSMNVTLADLAINIRAHSTVNLLDEKHYQLKASQLEESFANGSIFRKRDKIKRRQMPPPPPVEIPIPVLQNPVQGPPRERSTLVIEHKEYDELKLADDKEMQKKLEEAFAEESADIEANAGQPPVQAKPPVQERPIFNNAPRFTGR